MPTIDLLGKVLSAVMGLEACSAAIEALIAADMRYLDRGCRIGLTGFLDYAWDYAKRYGIAGLALDAQNDRPAFAVDAAAKHGEDPQGERLACIAVLTDFGKSCMGELWR